MLDALGGTTGGTKGDEVKENGEATRKEDEEKLDGSGDDVVRFVTLAVATVVATSVTGFRQPARVSMHI